MQAAGKSCRQFLASWYERAGVLTRLASPPHVSGFAAFLIKQGREVRYQACTSIRRRCDLALAVSVRVMERDLCYVGVIRPRIAFREPRSRCHQSLSRPRRRAPLRSCAQSGSLVVSSLRGTWAS
jgi:hypothetical protein